MPSAPQILPTQITQGSAPGLNYRLEGELVPVLHMALDGRIPVYFEHHVLLWKYPQMQIGLHPLKKGLKRRAFGGMPLLLLEAQSAGEIAFSRDAPGHARALPADAGTAWGHGLRLGLHCGRCCVGLMAILLAIGVMDLRAMAVVTAAISIERLAPAGERAARATGAIAVGVGLLLIAPRLLN